MNREFNDDYYQKVTRFDWITEPRYYIEKGVPKEQAYIHTQLTVTNQSGEYVIKIDDEGVMINCTCGCIESFDTNFYDICAIEKSAKKLIDNQEQQFDIGFWRYNDREDEIDELFEKMKELSRSFKNKNKDMTSIDLQIEAGLRRVKSNLTTVRSLIEKIEILEKRESYVDKLKEILDDSD